MLYTAKSLSSNVLTQILNRHVSKSETRPALQLASFDGDNLVATNAHVLIKLDSSIIGGVLPTLRPHLLNPADLTISDYEGNYPKVEHLCQINAKESFYITKEQLSELDLILATAKSDVGKARYDKVLYELVAVNGLLTIRARERLETRVDSEVQPLNYSDTYRSQIKASDIRTALDGKYLKDLLTTARHILRVIEGNVVEVEWNSPTRPIHFNFRDKAKIVISPIRLQ